MYFFEAHTAYSETSALITKSQVVAVQVGQVARLARLARPDKRRKVLKTAFVTSREELRSKNVASSKNCTGS